MSELSLSLSSNAYPQRTQERASLFDRLAGWPVYWVGRLQSNRFSQRWMRSMRAYVTQFVQLDERDILGAARDCRYHLRRDGMRGDALDRALALCSTVAAHTMGSRINVRTLASARWMLDGKLVEGEQANGSVLALSAAVAALAGVRVHVTFGNPASAAREAAAAADFFKALGLTQAHVEAKLDETARRRAYASDIVYAYYREVAFDYLRDRVMLRARPQLGPRGIEALTGDFQASTRTLLNGLELALLQDADAMLLDDSHLPLTLAADVNADQAQRLLRDALTLAAQLVRDVHFMRTPSLLVELTAAGRERVSEIASSLGPLWAGKTRSEQLASFALTALELKCEQHYAVVDDVLELDETKFELETDRLELLRRLIETKEGCRVAGAREALASISGSGFFRRYLRIGGMTACSHGATRELWSLFGLRVISADTSARRAPIAMRMFATEDERWDELVQAVKAARAQGHAVIIGTRSPAAAREFARRLEDLCIDHRVLIGTQDPDESIALAEAALPGRVTVMVSLAARGASTHPIIDGTPHSCLRVFIAQALETSRHEQQFLARCRPGAGRLVAQRWLSKEDELIRAYVPHWTIGALSGVGFPCGLLVFARIRLQRAAAKYRRDLMSMEDHLGDALAFSGPRT